MQQNFTSNQFTDDEGRPAGGTTYGPGFTIGWQNGPLREQGSDDPAPANGAFVETIISAAQDRLNFYQSSGFACQENATAIDCLEAALQVLHERTSRRVDAGIEGTHQKDETEG